MTNVYQQFIGLCGSWLRKERSERDARAKLATEIDAVLADLDALPQFVRISIAPYFTVFNSVLTARRNLSTGLVVVGRLDAVTLIWPDREATRTSLRCLDDLEKFVDLMKLEAVKLQPTGHDLARAA